MPPNSPGAVTEAFITQVIDGCFDEAEETIHPAGPLEGTGELLMFFSIVFTQFLLQFALPMVPTDVSNVTLVDRNGSTAEVRADVTLIDRLTLEVDVELRTETTDTTDDQVSVERWRIWDVDV